jgi:DNA polymerase-3 subunit alpha
MDDIDRTYKNIAECRERGIRILPPDVNESREAFTVSGKDIRFGLGAVRGVGGKAIEVILAARTEPFASAADFARRVRSPAVNKRVVESLVKCGAFDSLGASRARLLAGLDTLLTWAERAEEEANSDQMGLFAGGSRKGDEIPAPPLPEVEELPSKDLLRFEKEAIGFFITGHPLDKYDRDLHRLTTASTTELASRSNQDGVTLGGVVHSVKLKNSKKGDRYATFMLEDREGVVEVIAWPDTYRKFEALIHGDEPLVVTGTVDVGEERCQVIAGGFRKLAEAREESIRQVHLKLSAERLTEVDLGRLRDTLSRYRGTCPAYLDVMVPGQSEVVIELPAELRVTPSEAMLDAVERLFGSGVAVLR